MSSAALVIRPRTATNPYASLRKASGGGAILLPPISAAKHRSDRVHSLHIFPPKSHQVFPPLTDNAATATVIREARNRGPRRSESHFVGLRDLKAAQKDASATPSRGATGKRARSASFDSDGSPKLSSTESTDATLRAFSFAKDHKIATLTSSLPFPICSFPSGPSRDNGPPSPKPSQLPFRSPTSKPRLVPYRAAPLSGLRITSVARGSDALERSGPAFQARDFLDATRRAGSCSLDIISTTPDEYVLGARLCGFTPEMVTITVRKSASIVIIADKWESETESHYEWRVDLSTKDVKLNGIRANFDSDGFLTIHLARFPTVLRYVSCL